MCSCRAAHAAPESDGPEPSAVLLGNDLWVLLFGDAPGAAAASPASPADVPQTGVASPSSSCSTAFSSGSLIGMTRALIGRGVLPPESAPRPPPDPPPSLPWCREEHNDGNTVGNKANCAAQDSWKYYYLFNRSGTGSKRT